MIFVNFKNARKNIRNSANFVIDLYCTERKDAHNYIGPQSKDKIEDGREARLKSNLIKLPTSLHEMENDKKK